jgi:choline dehydrogenase
MRRRGEVELGPSWVAYRDDLPELAKFLRDDLFVVRSQRADPAPYFGGRGLGGSSTINAQIALRAPLEQFDAWAREGADGWSSDFARAACARNESDREFGARERPGNRWSGVDRA